MGRVLARPTGPAWAYLDEENARNALVPAAGARVQPKTKGQLTGAGKDIGGTFTNYSRYNPE